jgi:LysM repeat protein
MRRYFLGALMLLFAFVTDAQNKDSLFTTAKDERLFIKYPVRKGETVFSIAQCYSVPAVVLAQSNDMSFQDKIEPPTVLLIPLGNYNFIKSEPSVLSTARPLFYKVKPNDKLSELSQYSSLDEAELIVLNNIQQTNLPVGCILKMGWVQYQPDNTIGLRKSVPETGTGSNRSSVVPATLSNTAAHPEVKDTTKELSMLEQIFVYQTSNGQSLITQSGMVVFFKSQSKVSNQLLFSFSDDIPKGKVVKVSNPSNGKFVFVKVLGPMPKTKQYHNAKIGIDDRAERELGINDSKLWCDLVYGG